MLFCLYLSFLILQKKGKHAFVIRFIFLWQKKNEAVYVMYFFMAYRLTTIVTSGQEIIRSAS